MVRPWHAVAVPSVWTECDIVQGSRATWKVVEFKKGIFRAWQSHGIAPVGREIFLAEG